MKLGRGRAVRIRAALDVALRRGSFHAQQAAEASAGRHPLNAPFGGLGDKSSTAAMTGRTL